MERNRLVFLASLVLVLTLATTALVASTYAKYATEVTATASVTVAKWQATFGAGSQKQQTDDFTFDLIDTLNDSGVHGDLLAPGTQGEFDIKYDTSGSQTARNVTIKMDLSELASLSGLIDLFYSLDGSTFTPIAGSFDQPVELLNQDFGPDPNGGSGTITVKWEWPFDGDDAADTAVGLSSLLNKQVTITFQAEQLDAYPAGS